MTPSIKMLKKPSLKKHMIRTILIIQSLVMIRENRRILVPSQSIKRLSYSPQMKRKLAKSARLLRHQSIIKSSKKSSSRRLIII